MVGLGLRYVAWENKWEYNSVPYPNRDPGLGGINHLPLAERSRIAASETVPPHKCCTDPTWLYRIYQDTTVDLDDLFMRVQDATAGLDFLSPHVPTDGPSLHDDVPMLPSQVGTRFAPQRLWRCRRLTLPRRHWRVFAFGQS